MPLFGNSILLLLWHDGQRDVRRGIGAVGALAGRPPAQRVDVASATWPAAAARSLVVHRASSLVRVWPSLLARLRDRWSSRTAPVLRRPSCSCGGPAPCRADRQPRGPAARADEDEDPSGSGEKQEGERRKGRKQTRRSRDGLRHRPILWLLRDWPPKPPSLRLSPPLQWSGSMPPVRAPPDRSDACAAAHRRHRPDWRR
jgi:hypothetical protein